MTMTMISLIMPDDDHHDDYHSDNVLDNDHDYHDKGQGALIVHDQCTQGLHQVSISPGGHHGNHAI